MIQIVVLPFGHQNLKNGFVCHSSQVTFNSNSPNDRNHYAIEKMIPLGAQSLHLVSCICFNEHQTSD